MRFEHGGSGERLRSNLEKNGARMRWDYAQWLKDYLVASNARRPGEVETTKMDSWDNPAYEAMQAYQKTAACAAAVRLERRHLDR